MQPDTQTTYLGADSLLFSVNHRPWLPPDGPWLMTQRWNHLLFAHYALDPAVLRALVPDLLTLDLYQGQAWLSITPFFLSALRPPGIPPVPGISAFPELNVRTYVTYEEKPGVYFFSLDAGNLSAVWGARMFYRLPYWHSDMKIERKGDAFKYRAKRHHGPKSLKGMPEFRGQYRAVGDVFTAKPRSLDEFLAERYCLYAWSRNRLYRGEIHHLPWPLQAAELEIETNTMVEPVGLHLPEKPDVLRFAESLKVLVWPPERLL